jgi:hypothetical protein
MKLVKFTWYPGADANMLKLRHDNRIQGLDWQRLTDAILALKQAGFVETVSGRLTTFNAASMKAPSTTAKPSTLSRLRSGAPREDSGLGPRAQSQRLR